jgi:hypothetical protein
MGDSKMAATATLTPYVRELRPVLPQVSKRGVCCWSFVTTINCITNAKTVTPSLQTSESILFFLFQIQFQTQLI